MPLVNLSKHELETIIYCLEGYLQGNDDEELSDEIVRICTKVDQFSEVCECKEQNDTYNKINSQKNDKEIRISIIKGSISKS